MEDLAQKNMEENTASTAKPNPESVPHARRRQFSSSEKQRILAAADRCTAPGEIGALLRSEGIYSSHLATWRKQRAEQEKAALEPKTRGPKPDPLRTEKLQLTVLGRENDQLRRQLAQAHLIIDVQKKVSVLLGQLTTDPLGGAS